MILEVRKWPESQEVMEDKEWFHISDGGNEIAIIGDSAYARVLDESDYILVEKTTADEYNDKRRGDRRGNPDRRDDHDTDAEKTDKWVKENHQDVIKEMTKTIKSTPEYKKGKSILSSIGYRGEE